MSIQRRPRRGSNEPSNVKSVRRQVNPDSYQKSYISWQFSFLDFDFQHGWNNIIDRIKTEDINDVIIELLECDCKDDVLVEALEKCSNTEYKNYDDFLKVVEKSNTKISINDLKILLRHIKSNYFWKYLYPKMKLLESVKWQDLERQTTGKNGKSKHHWVSVGSLIKPARDRLVELKLDDYDELFSIRLTGTERLWGIKELNYFKILWFDFNHDICPSHKKRT